MAKKGDGVRLLENVRGSKKWEIRIYWIDQRTGKERERQRVFRCPSKAQALAERDRMLEEARNETSAEPKIERKRFGEVFDEYVGTIKTYSTRKAQESRGRTIKAAFGDWWIDAMAPGAIQVFLDGLQMEWRSANNVRAAMLKTFNHAVRARYVKDNPVKLTERRRPHGDSEAEEDEDAPEKALTPGQVSDLLADLELNEPALYPMVFTQFMLGCRFAEVSALRKQDVDLEAGIVKIRRGQYLGQRGRTKGRFARTAGLPEEARELLKAHLAEMEHQRWPGWEELVFPRPVTHRKRTSDFWACSTVDHALRRAFKRLGIEVEATTHIPRYTMATIADEIEAPEALWRKVMGHRSREIHLGYKHPPAAQVVGLAEKYGAKLGLAGTGTKSGTQDGENGGDA